MTKESHKRGQRFCLWCGKPASRKGEHIWPVWAKDFLPSSRSYTTSYISGPAAISNSEVRKWNGSLKTKKVPFVCERCNNGWMNTLETAVRPWLEPIIRMKPINIECHGAKALAEYFCMKAMVADKNKPGLEVFSSGEVNDFYESRTLPAGMVIRLYRYLYDANPKIVQFDKEAPPQIDVETGVRSINMANFTLRFGFSLFQVLFVRNSPGAFNYNPRKTISIYPVTTMQHWPPTRRLITSEAHFIQHYIKYTVRHLIDSGHLPRVKEI